MKETIKMPNDVVRIITPLYQQRDCEVEHCAIMVIDNCCQVKSVHFVGQGSESECVIPLKVICKKAILDLASGVILIHNHPSGVCKPSTYDIKQTERLRDMLRTLDISLIDHIVIGEDRFFSFAEEKEFGI